MFIENRQVLDQTIICGFLTVSASSQFVQAKCWQMHFVTSVNFESGKVYDV